MTMNALTAHECGQITAYYALVDICERANALRAQAIALGQPFTPPSLVQSLVFDLPAGHQGAGAGAALYVVLGMADPARDTCEGFRIQFTAGELPAACAALAQMSAEYQDYVANDLRQRIRAASALPPQERSAFPDFEPDCPLE